VLVGHLVLVNEFSCGRVEPVLRVSGFLGFEPQLLSDGLPVKIDVVRANLIALNLSEGSPRIGGGVTGRWGAVHKWTGVGAV